MNPHTCRIAALAAALSLAGLAQATAAEIKVLTAGAFKQVVVVVVPAFEKQIGHKVTVDNDTAGGLKKRIEVKGAALVGPLPKEIQNTTTYAAGLSASAQNKDAAMALIKAYAGPGVAALLKSKGMEPAS